MNCVPSDVVTVLRFYGTPEQPNAYVVFVDSAFEPGSATSVSIVVRVQGGTAFAYSALIPTTTTAGASSGADGTFPADSAGWPFDTVTFWDGATTSLTLTVVEPYTPFVWFTNKLLQFAAAP